MIVPEIVEFFANKKNIDDRGIPKIPSADWKKLISTYDKEDVRHSLSEYITTNNIPFPFRQISAQRAKNLFVAFHNTSFLDNYKNLDNVQEKYTYQNKYSDKPLGVIDSGSFFNKVADHFQQENRLKCGSIHNQSPVDIWSDATRLNKMNWHFFRNMMADADLDDAAFRQAFRLGTYTATQFKPAVAKALYEKHDAINVLDTSCGWGDRLAGFYATRSTKLYVGCDPNPDVFEVYKKQCIFYESMICEKKPVLIERENYFECIGSKTVKIWNLPAEDVDWGLYTNTFDFYFTSPPYFETEKYGSDSDKSENQSWFRYNSFDGWKKDFLFKVTESVWPTIRDDGFMMINIIEPASKSGKRNKLCDDMVNHFVGFEKCFYLGKLGMRMAVRPNNNVSQSDNFIEPIWTFRKNNKEYIPQYDNTLDKFFN